MRLYCRLLEEANARLLCIEHGLNSQFNLPGPFLRELCFLQLRMLCELIALGCLTAHGDIGNAPVAKIKKEWHAGRIIAELETLHPDFYPVPITQEERAPGRFHMTERDPTFTKEDLFELYNKSGDVLHKGNIQKLLTANLPVQTNFPDVIKWARKIAGLLAIHGIALFGGQRLVCYLKATNRGGYAHVALASPAPHGDPVADA